MNICDIPCEYLRVRPSKMLCTLGDALIALPPGVIDINAPGGQHGSALKAALYGGN
jgi:hypothetical protein